MDAILGKYFDMVKDHISQHGYPLSFLSDKYSDAEKWQSEARAAVRALISYNPPATPLDPQTHDNTSRTG